MEYSKGICKTLYAKGFRVSPEVVELHSRASAMADSYSETPMTDLETQCQDRSDLVSFISDRSYALDIK